MLRRLAGLSAVVPAWNEADNVEEVVGGLLAALPSVAERFEVVVVDDGSRDRTPEVLSALAARDARVRIVRHEKNLGYGAALRSGFAAAREPWVFFTDADAQFAASEIGRLVALAQEADIVAGYRQRRADPWRRRASGWLWNRLVRTLFGLPLRDVNCAFKLIRSEVLRAFPLESTGALINTELVARAMGSGYRVREVAVSHFPRLRGAATGGRPDVVARAFRELFALAGRLARGGRGRGRREPAAFGTKGAGETGGGRLARRQAAGSGANG